MTPDEHARAAEDLLSRVKEGPTNPWDAQRLGMAQVHATLSLRGTRAPRGSRPASPKTPKKTTKEKDA